jgi:hypothetical protein
VLKYQKLTKRNHKEASTLLACSLQHFKAKCDSSSSAKKVSLLAFSLLPLCSLLLHTSLSSALYDHTLCLFILLFLRFSSFSLHLTHSLPLSLAKNHAFFKI